MWGQRKHRTYTVVENAGYLGERDVHTTKDLWTAIQWANTRYSEHEIDDLHVAVAYDDENGKRSYEL